MPYSMMHIEICARIADALRPESLSEYYLGCVAPDAVHFHPRYDPSLKCASHLVPAGVAWGDCREEINAPWLENIRRFLAEADAEPDFKLGYAAHLAQDVYNNMTIWTPLRRRAAEENDPSLLADYRGEQLRVEKKLVTPLQDALRLLALPEPSGVAGVIEAADIRAMRAALLAPDYPPAAPEAPPRCLTPEALRAFLEGAAAFTVDQLAGIRR